MDEIRHYVGVLKHRNSQDFRDLRWCKIPSINRMGFSNWGGVGTEERPPVRIMSGRGYLKKVLCSLPDWPLDPMLKTMVVLPFVTAKTPFVCLRCAGRMEQGFADSWTSP